MASQESANPRASAFDLLSVPGEDIRQRPLAERWDMLSVVLAGAAPPLQQLMATRSLAEAKAWHRDMRGLGLEGAVCNSLLNERVEHAPEGRTRCRHGGSSGSRTAGRPAR